MALRASVRAHTGIRGRKTPKEATPLSEALKTHRRRTLTDVEKMVRAAEQRRTPAARLMGILTEAGAGDYVQEYPFARPIGRRWCFDVAFVPERVAVEVEGGIFRRTGDEKPCPTCKQVRKGAHASVAGILRDIEKYNAAVMLGWRVYRVPTNKINRTTAREIALLLGRKPKARRIAGVRRGRST
jgi:hypothetical protein